jgi:fructose-1,6-bisphosphatase I
MVRIGTQLHRFLFETEQQKLDPLDGSSNLDVNGAVGSIFSVRRLSGRGDVRSEADLMARISQEQVVAGYFLYGPSTTLVYTEGGNEGTMHDWESGPRRFLEWARESDPATGRPYSTRYSGALVAEAAGGAASDGRRRILDIRPTSNHERTPIYLGSKGDVARVDAYVASESSR